MLREHTTRRRWASVVGGPEDNLAPARVLSNVLGGDDVAAVWSRHAGTVDSGTESSRGDAVNPGIDVSVLLGQHASALLLIEKNNRCTWEPFSAGCSRGGLRVRLSDPGSIGDGFQCGIEPSVEQNQESETRRLDGAAMPDPIVRRKAGRVVEPISGVGKSLPQRFEVSVARIFVAVEAEVGRCPIL